MIAPRCPTRGESKHRCVSARLHHANKRVSSGSVSYHAHRCTPADLTTLKCLSRRQQARRSASRKTNKRTPKRTECAGASRKAVGATEKCKDECSRNQPIVVPMQRMNYPRPSPFGQLACAAAIAFVRTARAAPAKAVLSSPSWSRWRRAIPQAESSVASNVLRPAGGT